MYEFTLGHEILVTSGGDQHTHTHTHTHAYRFHGQKQFKEPGIFGQCVPG